MNEWYYARGGKQFGPVPLDTLIGLAKSGGLDPVNDLVWTSTMKDWLPAGQVAGIFTPVSTTTSAPADPSNPYSPPVNYGHEPIPSAIGSEIPEIIPGSQPLQPTSCIKRSFDLVMRNFGMILLIGLVYLIVTSVVGALLTGIDSALHLSTTRHVQFQEEGITHFVHSSFEPKTQPSFLHTILSNILSIFLSLGLTRIGLNLVSGKEISVEMLFGGGRKLLPAILGSIVYGLMVFVGLLLLIFPGIYLALRYGQFLNAIVDRDLPVIDAFNYSASITTNNKMNLFLMGLLMLLVIIAGALAILLGLIVAIPVCWLGMIVAYRWMQYGYIAALDHPGTKTPMLSGAP